METAPIITVAIGAATLESIALVAFLGIWVVVVLRLVLSRSDRYHRAARIPLHDDPVTGESAPRDGKDTTGNGAAAHD